ncbi:MAG: hypothetical protein NVSMB14_17300 [Isosphaeraceae bacterium]
MDRTRVFRRPLCRLLPLAVLFACGCQTVRTPESKIAKSNIPGELRKTTMPDYVIEPPDTLIVEVYSALPGRPLARDTEHLVRPDGKISLGFYGEVYVTGLTLDQAKEKIILHLRKYLPDESLGLIKFDAKGEPVLNKDGKPVLVDPVDSQRVSVDIASYSSKVFYVQGDVGIAGRFPITGNETVLDALSYAGGLLPTAASQNIRLVRPGPPDGCCPQVLPVNYAAIVNAGDTTTNYQLMPGDRLVVYRDPVERFNGLVARLAAPVQLGGGVAFQYLYLANLKNFFGGGARSTATTPSGATSIPPSR